MTPPRPLSLQEESLARMCLASSNPLSPGFSRTTVAKMFATIDALRAQVEHLTHQLTRCRDRNILPFPRPRDPAA